jgi:hypothetical protein
MILRNPMNRSILRVLVLAVAALPVAAQVNEEAYRSYFLVGQFGEVCTMCEIVVVCTEGEAEPGADAMPSAGQFTLYHLRTRTFWSQMATIWEWFIANFSTAALAQGHSRPVWIYEVTGTGWSGPEIVEAHIALEPPLLAFGDRAIDRRSRAWLDGDTRVGYCARLPLWDSLERIEAATAGGAAE